MGRPDIDQDGTIAQDRVAATGSMRTSCSSGASPATLTSIPLLDRADCDLLCNDLGDLRPQWVARTREPASFFTLGMASYLDLSEPMAGFPRHDYYREAPGFNALLTDRFGWLLERVKVFLESWLGAQARLSRKLAVPGFHIFDYLAIPRADVASIHFDLQYQLIDWHDGGPPPDFDSPISFTLPIKLPRDGGGLNVWDLTWQEMVRGRYCDIPTAIGQRRKSFHRYSLGALAVHSGHYLHQIAGVADVQREDQRITLQGHGIRRGEEWLLYW